LVRIKNTMKSISDSAKRIAVFDIKDDDNDKRARNVVDPEPLFSSYMRMMTRTQLMHRCNRTEVSVTFFVSVVG
jgi:hypothetical protein